jgi:hypothetical protein
MGDQRREPRVADPQVEVEPENEITSVEVPEADAAEQARAATDRDEDRVGARPVPLDADPADLAEQGREVDFDEDEYR